MNQDRGKPSNLGDLLCTLNFDYQPDLNTTTPNDRSVVTSVVNVELSLPGTENLTHENAETLSPNRSVVTDGSTLTIPTVQQAVSPVQTARSATTSIDITSSPTLAETTEGSTPSIGIASSTENTDRQTQPTRSVLTSTPETGIASSTEITDRQTQPTRSVITS